MKKKNIIIALIIIIALGISIFVFHPHAYKVDAQTASSCTESGSTIYKCWCGKTYSAELPATGHDYVEEITKEATCTDAGERTFTCSVCGDSYSESISAVGHKYIENKDNADKDHCLVYVCSNCGDLYEESHHDFSFVESDRQKTYQCSKCGYVSFTISLFEEPQEMFAQKDCDAHKGPATDYDKVKVLKVNEKIEVIGIVSEVDDEETYWVVYKDKDENELFVSGAYVDTKPITQTSNLSSGSKGNSSTNNISNNTTQSSEGQQQSSSKNTGLFENEFWGGPVNHDYSTSGTIETGKVTEGANWAP